LGRAELNHDLFTNTSEFPDAKRLQVIKQVSLSKDRQSLGIRLLEGFIFCSIEHLLLNATNIYIFDRERDYIDNTGNIMTICEHKHFTLSDIDKLVSGIENDVETSTFKLIGILYS
jgi:hypothetical protein